MRRHPAGAPHTSAAQPYGVFAPAVIAVDFGAYCFAAAKARKG